MLITDTEIFSRNNNGIMTVTLNRPEALNALTLEMIRILSAALTRWETDDNVRAVVFTGAGDRAFCAGGDIKACYTVGMSYRRGASDERAMTVFFEEEYRLNRRLFHYKKPLFAFMNGITMGGGFGIAGPCRYRIASEKTTFAMPETGIGFFPDVGSAWFLNRCPGEAGTYLGVTGNTIGADDMTWCGLATHLIPSQSWVDCTAALAGTETADFESVLKKFSTPPAATGPLRQNAERIDSCFSHDSIEAVLKSLQTDGGDWAQATGDLIGSRSPVSLKVALRHLRAARTMSFDATLDRDIVICRHFMRGHDFYEGVRAALIDKDKTPLWLPARIEDIAEADIARYFEPDEPGALPARRSC